MVLKKIAGEYVLVSKSNKVLKRFGIKKPSRKMVLKEERRVQFFKKVDKIPIKAHTREKGKVDVIKHKRRRRKTLKHPRLKPEKKKVKRFRDKYGQIRRIS
jgi:hypothetical protein